VLISDVKVRIQFQEQDVFYYPDVMIGCDRRERDRLYLRYPKILVEVSSDSTDRIDRHEKRFPPKRPLLPLVESLNQKLPRKWDRKLNRFVPDDDWLLWDFHTSKIKGKHVESVRR
jgi:hypothetical protein